MFQHAMLYCGQSSKCLPPRHAVHLHVALHYGWGRLWKDCSRCTLSQVRMLCMISQQRAPPLSREGTPAAQQALHAKSTADAMSKRAVPQARHSPSAG